MLGDRERLEAQLAAWHSIARLANVLGCGVDAITAAARRHGIDTSRSALHERRRRAILRALALVLYVDQRCKVRLAAKRKRDAERARFRVYAADYPNPPVGNDDACERLIGLIGRAICGGVDFDVIGPAGAPRQSASAATSPGGRASAEGRTESMARRMDRQAQIGANRERSMAEQNCPRRVRGLLLPQRRALGFRGEDHARDRRLSFRRAGW